MTKSSRKRKPVAPRKKKPALTKKETKQVTKMINRALDIRVEDKYLLDSVFSDIAAPAWDANTESILSNYTPVIVEGADAGQRIGKKVTLKNLRIQIKYLPYSRHFSTPIEGDNSETAYALNPFQQLPPVEVFFISVPRQLYADVSGAEIRQACAVKFREPGVYRQDFYDNTGQRLVKSIKFIAKTRLSRKYRTLAVPRGAYTSVGISYPQAATIVNAAQFDNTVLKAKLGRKVLFETNSPAREVFLLYAHFGSKWHDPGYNGPITRPQKFETRVLWTYEDA